MANTARVSVFNVVGCGNGLASIRIDYERQQPSQLTQPRRVRPAGDRANHRVRDYGFGVAVGWEGHALACARVWKGRGNATRL